MMELVVAMLITTVVISMGFYAFQLFSKLLVKKQAQAGKLSEYLLFRRTLCRDMDRAAEVRDSATDGPLLLVADGQTLYYLPGPTYILRRSGERVDTFFVGGKTRQVQYIEGRPLITALQIRVFVNGDSIDIPFYKHYTARELLSAENTGNE
jgi:hypothetical protein